MSTRIAILHLERASTRAGVRRERGYYVVRVSDTGRIRAYLSERFEHPWETESAYRKLTGA